ncbi:hypothetical protein Y032_0149g2725 [Ancylostoma ceylanicum]|uniref:Uncharacterized protein n=1 Tax=Ancylostoma ceylanicum TaxID=53326 RepID=A0A016T1L0_9BILA|nr:hypothetical protein Y032_0149g2725 [Ancylostoma ceylanicum]
MGSTAEPVKQGQLEIPKGCSKRKWLIEGQFTDGFRSFFLVIYFCKVNVAMNLDKYELEDVAPADKIQIRPA